MINDDIWGLRLPVSLPSICGLPCASIPFWLSSLLRRRCWTLLVLLLSGAVNGVCCMTTFHILYVVVTTITCQSQQHWPQHRPLPCGSCVLQVRSLCSWTSTITATTLMGSTSAKNPPLHWNHYKNVVGIAEVCHYSLLAFWQYTLGKKQSLQLL